MPTAAAMPSWKSLLAKSLTRPADLERRFRFDLPGLRAAAARFPLRINPYYLGLLTGPGDGLWEQVVPDARELEDPMGQEDPLDEEGASPVPNLVHRYPDRALFLVASQCAVYCRFCTRRRKVGSPRLAVTGATIRAGLDYLARTAAIRDVLVSGGDPLLLEDDRLAGVLAGLRRIPHIEIIRIGSRVPCTLPARVTRALARSLARFGPLYLFTHFNHPREVTPEAARACRLLVEAGIPVGCQTVLLAGINDQPAVLLELWRRLLAIRVTPYYLFQMDLTRGTGHFRTPLAKGREIMAALWAAADGLPLPHFGIDLPGGGGKVTLGPPAVAEAGGPVLCQTCAGLAGTGRTQP
ncbi:MAG: KamA family radical SAM protein [Thermodesulfobacteriota bacterium]